MPEHGVNPEGGAPLPSPAGVPLPPATRAALLDPAAWEYGLERYARATGLAVALVAADGTVLGRCLNPQPTWSLLRANKPAGAGECPFSLGSPEPCSCSAHALATAGPVTVRDHAGLVHFAVPLALDGQRLGALLAGQVFDRYPEQLAVEQVAKRCGLPPDRVAQTARRERPVSWTALQVYTDLLTTLGDAFLQTRRRALLEADRLAERRRAEEELRKAYEELEVRVAQRTAELDRANRTLRAEVAERKQAEEARQELLGQLVAAQEEERRHIARELHDEMGQHLTAFLLGLKSLQESACGRSSDVRLLNRLQATADELAQKIHQLALELRPPALDDLGLLATLLHYAEEWSERYRIELDVHSTGLESERLPLHLETAFYRIVQEALTNVLKHAQARRVSLILERCGGHVLAVVEDDGRGFDAEELMRSPGKGRALGLLGMRERVALLGGTLQIESSPGQGTTLFVRVPLEPGGREGGHA